jgi:hypothetical protein
MRYRGAGRIAGFSDQHPQSFLGACSGAWKLGEATQWLSVSRWPRRSITIYNLPEYLDTTVGGYGQFQPSVYSEYGYYSAQWQKSVDDGVNWSNVINDQYHDIDPFSAWLTLTGQRRVDDGRLYRLRVTSGLRYVTSEPIPLWNDEVQITWNQQPQSTSAPDLTNADFTAAATATGIHHELDYDVSYYWQRWRPWPSGASSHNPTQDDDVDGDGVADEGEWKDFQPNASVDPTQGLLEINPVQTGINGYKYRARATFTYSDPPDHIVADRPDVVSYSDPATLTVTQA